MEHDTLHRIARGETEALGELAQAHEAALIGLARGLLGGSRPLAEEAVQDVWLRVLRASLPEDGARETPPHARFRGDAAVTTWLYRITINRCRDIQKRETRRARRERSPVRLAGAPPPDNSSSESSPTERQDRAAALHAALLALPPVQREAVLLCHHHGVSQSMAAEVLAIPEGTLKSRVRAGLAALRRSLDDAGQETTKAGYSDAG